METETTATSTTPVVDEEIAGVEAPGTGFSAIVDSSISGGQKSGSVGFTNKELDLINNASSQENVMNAPMLVAWIFKNVDEEPTLIAGLKYLLAHLTTGEGCKIFQKHNACETVIRAHYHYRANVQVQQLCISIFKQLLDCNLTRGALIDDSTHLMRVCFNISHLFMSSASHVEAGCRCLAQCCRSEICRVEIMKNCVVGYCCVFLEKHMKNASVARSVLKIFNWVTTTQQRMEELCRGKCLGVCLKAMKAHGKCADVLQPAMLFLTRAASTVPQAMAYILKKNAVSLVIKSLQAIHFNDVLQHKGLLMLHTLAQTSEGWEQISKVRGGWQTICQGVPLGNELVHDLEGELHNPGWALGDTNVLPMIERQRIEANAACENKKAPTVKATWTTLSLREYMGINTRGQKLSVNNESFDIYFELLKTLDLLPVPKEEREYWYQRVSAYEREMQIKLTEMAETVLLIRHKDALDAKKAAELSTEEGAETVKPVFVMGNRISMEYLATQDMDVSERLNGIV